MPEVSWAELSHDITDGLLPPVEEAPYVLGSATAEILTEIYADPQWYVMRRTLEHLVAKDGIAQILTATPGALAAALAAVEAFEASYSAAEAAPSSPSSQAPRTPGAPQEAPPHRDAPFSQIEFGSLRDTVLPDTDAPPDPQETAQRLEAELAHAEADLRRRLPQISARLSQLEKAADQITTDSDTRKLVARVAGAVKHHAQSGLSPIALLVILWWLFVVVFPRDAANDVAVLALWYAAARDLWKKGD